MIKALLIDDSEADASFITEILGEYPLIQITWVNNLTRAIDTLKSNIFDIILLDLNMPDAPGGIATFEYIQQLGLHIPIVILTGLEDEEISLTSVREGAQDFFVKNNLDLGSGHGLARCIRFSINRHQHAFSSNSNLTKDLDNIRSTLERLGEEV